MVSTGWYFLVLSCPFSMFCGCTHRCNMLRCLTQGIRSLRVPVVAYKGEVWDCKVAGKWELKSYCLNATAAHYDLQLPVLMSQYEIVFQSLGVSVIVCILFKQSSACSSSYAFPLLSCLFDCGVAPVAVRLECLVALGRVSEPKSMFLLTILPCCFQ